MPRLNKDAQAVDKLVGERIRVRRLMSGLTLPQIAEKVGVTYQGFRKYEIAENRVTAGKLSLIAKALGVPVSYFFDETPKEDHPDRITLNYAREFDKLTPPMRQAVVELMRAAQAS